MFSKGYHDLQQSALEHSLALAAGIADVLQSRPCVSDFPVQGDTALDRVDSVDKCAAVANGITSESL